MADTPKTEKRSPIVVVMGHVDHGKTSLLDFIRKTSVASREAGGITQSIGAYEIDVMQTNTNLTQANAEKNSKKSTLSQYKSADRKITFVDTPGHEAFSKMRSRGANVADLAILVVAADDGVKPQTKESIEILQKTKTPFVVAINKIDKNNANLEGAKNDLMQNGVYLEGYGGNVSYQPISAKTGEGVKELLDLVLLAAEMENLEADFSKNAKGVIIEAKMDSRRGITASALVKDGTLKTGDEIRTASSFGKIKILEDFAGQRVTELKPSSPALILGFEKLPEIGEEFFTGKTEVGDPIRTAPQKYEERPVLEKKDSKIRVIIKADVSGSLEAIYEILKAIQGVEILDKSVGDITDGDVKAAIAGDATILSFRTKIAKSAENLAKANTVRIFSSGIIYELVKEVEDRIKKASGREPASILEILAIFGEKKGKRQIVGGKVISGIIKNYSEVEIRRGDQILGTGKIISLQKQKSDATQVGEGEECGMLIESDADVLIGDKILTY